MKRTIIKIDEEKCTGCGLCVLGCHEGALQLIDNKARLVSELYCDGLGACIGECPEGAITLETREAEPYNEFKVIERISKQGEKTIRAHLKHLYDHKQFELVSEGLEYLKEKKLFPHITEEFEHALTHNHSHHHVSGSCPGSKMMDFRNDDYNEKNEDVKINSQLRHWPIQLHLINPTAPYFKNADVIIAADCVAYAYGNFHNDYLKGKSCVIACPKLDSDTYIYIAKIKNMIDEAHVNTITVVMMEVPCCNGLLKITKQAIENSQRKVPVKSIYVSIKGNILKEE